MAQEPLEAKPLREKFREAERLTRELIQHLDHGFAPKIHQVVKVARRGVSPTKAETVADKTVRSAIDTALTSHEYTIELTRKLESYLDAITKELHEIAYGRTVS